MKARNSLLFALFLAVAASACNGGGGSDSDTPGDSESAIETNVSRGDCADAGDCDAGANGSSDEEIMCGKDADCPDTHECGAKGICKPRVAQN